MALPALDKTWQFNVNNIQRTTGTALGDNQKLVRALKNALIGFGLSAWTVRGSSNSAAFGLDNVDRWLADANLVWANAGTNHSWIVLKNTNLGANVEVCIDLRSTTPSRIDVVMSYAAPFAGGSLTARPTAAGDEVSLTLSATSGYAYHGLGDNTTFDCVWHVMHSTDGQSTRLFVCKYDNTCAMWANFSKVKNPSTGWTVPVVGCWLDAGTNKNTGNPQFVALNDYAWQYGRQAPTQISMFCTSEGIIASMIGEARYSYNDISNEWSLTPVGLASETANVRGRHGTLYDLYWGSIYRQPGDSWPNDNTRQFIQIGHLVVPWNGTIPQFGL